MLFLWLVVVQLALFASLVVFLRIILARNIAKATSHLHTLNEDYTQKLEEAKKRQADAERFYDDTILKTKIEAEKTRIDILQEAHKKEDEIVAESRRQGEEIIEQANRARETAMKEIESRIEKEGLQRAVELIQAILPNSAGHAVHNHWVEELLKNGLNDLGRLNISDALETAEVLSAYPLEATQKKALEKILKEKLRRDLTLKEKIDEGLIAGLKVVLGSIVIDGTLLSRMKEVARHAERGA